MKFNYEPFKKPKTMNNEINSKFNQEHEKIVKSIEITKATLLIETTSQSERAVLKEAGLDFIYKEKDDIVGVNLDRKRVQEEFKTKFFTYNEIEQMCHKYHFRFLPSKYYKGQLNKETGAKLIEFFKERNIDSVAHEANANLFIMANTRAFNLDEKPNRKSKHVPALFYRVRTTKEKDGGQSMFAVIYDKGLDMSLWRQFLGVYLRKESSYLIINQSLMFFIAMVTLALTGWHKIEPAFWIMIVLSQLALAVYHLITFADGRCIKTFVRTTFSDGNWKSEDSRRKELNKY